MDVCGVYRIRNTVTEESYIGSSVTVYARWAEHRRALRRDTHRNYKLGAAWALYGEPVFEFVLLEISMPELRLQAEQRFIDHYDSFNSGYNLTPRAGSMKLYRFSEERRKNLSVAQLRRFQEHPLTTEQIERLRGLAAAHKGIPRPANLRQQISDKLKNRTFLPNSLQRMKAGQRRRFESSPMPLETKLKI